MKKFHILYTSTFIISILFICFHCSYADKIDWAISIGGVDNEHIDHVLVCPNNDVIVIGTFRDSIIFEHANSKKDTIICEKGFEYAFVARFNPEGKFKWVKTLAPAAGQFDWWNFPFVDQYGDLLLCGRFLNGIIISKDQPDEISFTSPIGNSTDIFLVRILSTGLIDWAIKAGDDEQEQVWDIAGGSDGSVYITGIFYGKTIFFPGGMNADIILDGIENSHSLYIVKYDRNGDLQWAKSINSEFSLSSNSIAVSHSGKVLIGGDYSNTLVFKTDGMIDTTIIANGETDIFAAIYDSTGHFLLAISEGGNQYDICQDVIFDNSENIIITGYFSGTLIVDSVDTLRSDDSWYANSDDIFLFKYDPEGRYLWSLREGGPMLDSGEELQIYDNDKIILSGYYWIEAIFSSGNMNETTISNIADTSSHFAAQYSSDGQLLWVADVDSMFETFNTNVLIGPDQAMIRSGDYYGNIDLMSNENIIPLKSKGGSDIYLAKFNVTGTSVSKNNEIKNEFMLSQNYPNPFNPNTTIEYAISKSENVKLEIFNILGEKTDTFVDEIQPAGNYKLNVSMHHLPSGIYFFKLTAGQYNKTNKMILLK